MANAKPNLSQQITDQIIAAIEEGCAPWRKPWTGGSAGAALPLRHNGEPYRGINILVLWSVAASMGYTSARWLTFKQAKTLGGAVRKGERSSTVIYYTTKEIEDEEQDCETKLIPLTKSYRVFNADQIDGLAEDFYTIPEPARDLGAELDSELEAYFAATGADTPDALTALPAPPDGFEGARVVYAEGTTVSPDRLKAEGVVFKQIPYQIEGA